MTRLVLGEAVGVAITGVVIGVPAGLAATRLIRAQLFGVGTIDLPSLSIAIVVLVATAVVASYCRRDERRESGRWKLCG